MRARPGCGRMVLPLGTGDAPMDPLKINDEIAELKRELMQLQIQQQEAQRANDFDLNNRLRQHHSWRGTP